ncbi:MULTISPECIES: hypothetical protein [unclassified Streptomyces]|uniref:hypothetical protein n=1 Tax=unclassified Streptomyces TaxID=2593676 RepID=UPI003FD48098
MAGFLDRAKEQAQRGLEQGRHKLDEVQAQRAGGDLLKKLGAAYYAQQHGTGSPEATQKAMAAVESHASSHGDSFMRGERS